MVEDDLAKVLEDASVGALNATIFIGPKAIIPPGDGPYLSIMATGGTSPERVQNSVSPPAFRRPGAQVVVRAKDNADAMAMAVAACAALDVRNTTVNGRWYRQITPRQEPSDMQAPDELNRDRIVFNVLVEAGT